jgi:hypothetical protein
MMNSLLLHSAHATLRLGENQWPIQYDPAEPATLTAALEVILADQPAVRDEIPLLLSGELCIPSLLANTADLPRRTDAPAWRYALEETLPLDADDLTCAFLHNPDGSAFAVAVQTERIAPLLAAIESAGLPVGAILPAAVTAGNAIRVDHPEEDTFLIRFDESADLLIYSGESLLRWHHIRKATPKAIQSLLTAGGITTRPVAIHFDPNSLGLTSPLDLRRGELRRKSAILRSRKRVLTLAGLVPLLLIVLSGACLLRAEKFQTTRSRYQQAERDVYRRVHPETRRTPVAPRRQLEAELKKAPTSPTSTTNSPEALIGLRDLVAALPASLQIDIVDLRIEGNSIDISAIVPSYSAVDVLTRSLRARGYTPAPPRSQQTSTGIRVQLRAEKGGAS